MTDTQAATVRTTGDDIHRQFIEDTDYVWAHWPTLREKYPQEWIAVFGQAVVAHGKTIDQVIPVHGHPEYAGRTAVCFTGDEDPFYQK
jgi:hypothetical protein